MKAEPYVTHTETRPAWLDMIPVKRYKHYTRFFKPTAKGNGYYECYLNPEVDRECTKRGVVLFG